MKRISLTRLPTDHSTQAPPLLHGFPPAMLSYALEQPQQVAKAEELHALGYSVRARNIALCGYLHPCGHRRDCPRCGARAAGDYAARVAACLRRMRAPTVLLLALPSRSVFDLREALIEVRKSISRLRRRKCMAGVTDAVGALEFPLAESGVRWAVHCHMAWQGSFDRETVSAAYAETTRGRGRLLFDARAGVLTVGGLASYVTKPGSWSVEAGLDLRLLRLLRAAVRYRRPLLGWGEAWQTARRSPCTR